MPYRSKGKVSINAPVLSADRAVHAGHAGKADVDAFSCIITFHGMMDILNIAVDFAAVE